MRLKFLFLVFFIPLLSNGQLISDVLSERYINPINGPGYLKPINDIYSASIHSGVFPRYSEKGFHFKLGFHGTRITISDKMRTFDGMTSGLDNNIGAAVPTIVGNREATSVTDDRGLNYTFPGGLDLVSLTVAVPELYIGTLLGTDFYARYAQVPLLGSLGDMTLMGGGIRHDFGRYFFPEYVKWYISYSYHQSETSKGFTSENHYAMSQFGFKLNRIGIYGLAGYELNNMKYNYTNDGGEAITLELNETSPFRFGGGLNLSYKFFDLYGEYTLSDPVNIVFGFSIGI